MKGKSNLQEGEKGMKIIEVTKDGLKKMIESGKMKDGPTMAAFSILNNYNV